MHVAEWSWSATGLYTFPTDYTAVYSSNPGGFVVGRIARLSILAVGHHY